MERHLELKIVSVENDEVTFKIEEQTHRLKDFSKQFNPRMFTASNGIMIRSCREPDFQLSILYVRGMVDAEDDAEITVSQETFFKICEAVEEYNKTDGKGYCEKKWPQVGDQYFYIDSFFDVKSRNYAASYDDRCKKEVGNFFCSGERAQIAAEFVKKFLKKVNIKFNQLPEEYLQQLDLNSI